MLNKEEAQYRGKVESIRVEKKDIPFNDWYYGGLIYDDTNSLFKLAVIDEDDGEIYSATPNQDTICRNTFQKDSTGEYAYERDILKVPNNKTYFTVVNDGGLLGIAPLDMVRYGDFHGSTLLINSDLAQDIISKSKILSNTVDSPEWLEKAEEVNV